jgi:subtilisin family serine protease
LKILLFTIILGLIVFWAGGPVLAQEPAATPPPPQPEFVSGEILVKFKPGVGLQNARQRLAEVKGSVARTINGIEVLQVKVPPGQEQAVIAKLRARTDVVYAEPNYLLYALETPNDPSYIFQWNLDKINMPAAWEITQGSSDIVVAIVDSGIDLDHPDFNCTVSSGASKITNPYNIISSGSTPADDDTGHGSHVAGIIGVCTNNALGVAGVAPNVRLMPIKALQNNSGSFSNVAAGIIRAVDQGAKVVNLSLGGSTGSSVLADAVTYAYNHNVLVVAAAGNFAQQGNPIFYPAAYPETMAVAATTSFDGWASFSEHHPYVDIAAPGVSIYSTVHGSLPAGNYGYKDGTSMAAPHVAGLAALIWSLDPGLTHNQVRQVIQNSAVDLGAAGLDEYFGYGRINAWQALKPYSVTLQDISGLEITGPITFMVDDEIEPIPASKLVQVITGNPNTITWTATLSPTVSWVSVEPPDTGTVSAQSGDTLTLIPTRPITYGTYTTTLLVNGVTAQGEDIGSATTQVKITYQAQLWRYRLSLLFKNSAQ